MENENLNQNNHPKTIKKLLKKFGIAGFLFFFIKGLLWLIVPFLITLGLFSC